MTPQQIAKSIADELRAHPERWTQGELCRDRKGRYCSMYSASSWCLMGHIDKRIADSAQWDEAEQDFARAARILSIAGFNDRAKGIEEVIALCERVAES